MKQSKYRHLSLRQGNILLCLIDTAVAPKPPLPEVTQTDAVSAFDRLLAHSPKPNRLLLQAALNGLEIGPLLLGFKHRFRALSPRQRTQYLKGLLGGHIAGVTEPLIGTCQMLYYGSPAVHAVLGYNPQQLLQAGKKLRGQEGRW